MSHAEAYFKRTAAKEDALRDAGLTELEDVEACRDIDYAGDGDA